ncbi:DUF4374 domain-containing protein [Sphingobacterium chuzhouense]|uniref:DUF4374 domain-containing protein n=1 Tax=Sphingobacterium chuzhouense TaxID=1742264 RepID=A0ABR7XXN0_9SPHI|nr:DUF4374 domain-containing protein [Sphingobacterium chuzhouense]MBD1423787.1 DUF4374 domain-containing protein [Sphingobacterium chuzhouense]
MKAIKNVALALGVLALGLSSCDKDDDVDRRTRGNFVLAVTPVAQTGVADYLINAPSLETGTISTEGNGAEQDGTYRYYLTHNNRFYSMLYGQGNPGAVTAYDLQDGLLNKVTNFQTETVQAFAPVNNDILLMKISRSLTSPESQWYSVDTDALSIARSGKINTHRELTENSEIAHFSWIKQVGNKVFAPFFSIKATEEGGWGTEYPDNAWIAVYSYPDMQLEKVIKDNRTSYIGRYFVDGLAKVENGDVYAFSPATAINNGKDNVFNSSKPSAITRIKAGTTAFDDYYFDLEAQTGGHNITNWTYIGNGKAVGHFTSKAEKGVYSVGAHIGIIDFNAKTVKFVTGFPEVGDIANVTTNNYTPLDGKTAAIGVTLKSGISYVYNINAETATATQGLKVEGGTITAISRLD